jgi:hypothetical protein
MTEPIDNIALSRMKFSGSLSFDSFAGYTTGGLECSRIPQKPWLLGTRRRNSICRRIFWQGEEFNVL